MTLLLLIAMVLCTLAMLGMARRRREPLGTDSLHREDLRQAVDSLSRRA